jgi:hypothetical protein
MVNTVARRGFDVIDLLPFNVAQTKSYLHRYITYFVANSGLTASSEKIDLRVNEIEALSIGHLLTRPVHAQMIAEIASDFDAQLTQVSRYRLYSAFVTFVLTRDYDRSGRAGLSPPERQRILQRIAWTLWFELERDSFGVSEVALDGEKRLSEAAVRGILAGALLESKYGDIFYFSHRSFQEYLVAEHMLQSNIDWEELGDRINLLSDEIVEFIQEAESQKGEHELYRSIEQSTTYWDKSIELAVVLYSKLYRDRIKITNSKIKRVSAGHRSLLKLDDKHEPFRLYCHAKMLLRDHDYNGYKQVISYMQTQLRDDEKYCFYCGQALVDGVRNNNVEKRYCYIEMIRLVLNLWDIRAIKKYYKGEKYFRMAMPDVVVLSSKQEWGTHVTVSQGTIKRAQNNPSRFYQSLRAGKEVSLRTSVGRLRNEAYSFKWSEICFVPPLCSGGPSQFGGEILEISSEHTARISKGRRVVSFLARKEE